MKAKPRHIGIIPDGNRRWAKEHGMEKEEGYTHGLNPGVELLKLAIKEGIEEITYYCFTTDNCKRPAAQLAAFSKACVDAVTEIASYPVSLLVVGNTESEAFPKELLCYTKRTEIHGGGIRVNFLVNYGWEWDLANMQSSRSRKSITSKLKSTDVSRIDLVIRWGGMRRLSGFLPIQSVYADFYVADTLWPDFKSDDFISALEWYKEQDVTLGG